MFLGPHSPRVLNVCLKRLYSFNTVDVRDSHWDQDEGRAARRVGGHSGDEIVDAGWFCSVCLYHRYSTIAHYPSFDQQAFLFSGVCRPCALYRFRQVPWAFHAPVSAHHWTVWRLI